MTKTGREADRAGRLGASRQCGLIDETRPGGRIASRRRDRGPGGSCCMERCIRCPFLPTIASDMQNND